MALSPRPRIPATSLPRALEAVEETIKIEHLSGGIASVTLLDHRTSTCCT
jgi:hypothetical protein